MISLLFLILAGLAAGVFLGTVAYLVLDLRARPSVDGDGLQGGLPKQTRRLIDRAIGQLPHELREPYRAEWIAELATLRGKPIRALVFALDCVRAARSEARELRPPIVRPARSHGTDDEIPTELDRVVESMVERRLRRLRRRAQARTTRRAHAFLAVHWKSVAKEQGWITTGERVGNDRRFLLFEIDPGSMPVEIRRVVDDVDEDSS